MDSQEFRAAAATTTDDIVNYFDNLGSRDVVSSVRPGYLRTLLPGEAPQEGEPWEDIHKDIEAKIMPGITHWSHPNFHAFFPCATSYPSILADLYSSALSGACFNWICSPAVTELETIVLDWLAKMLGLPACYLSTGPTRGGGVIQGSASEAVLTAMVAARDKYLRETTKIPIRSSELSDEDAEALAIKRSRMVALATTATHSSARKAALILGVRFKAIPVRAEDGYALTKPVLAAALAECRAKGLEPFFLVATLGTTDTCAVDDFAGISAALEEDPDAAVAESESGIAKGEIWVHVDAAYAGAALVCPEVQEATGLAGPLARFHSFDVNMHKWLLVNFDASCLYVRDRDWLVQALSVNQAVYGKKPLVDADGNDVPDYREWQIPLGRRFRSLKIWFVLRSYGVRALQAYIRRTMRLGEEFAGWVKGRPDLFEVLTGPSFALTVFRMAERSQGQSLEERNALTKALYERVNATGKLWLTSTELDGKLAIRLMTAVRTTERAHVKAAFKTLVEVATEVIRE